MYISTVKDLLWEILILLKMPLKNELFFRENAKHYLRSFNLQQIEFNGDGKYS